MAKPCPANVPILTGPRGGSYYLSPSGRKVYCVPSPAPQPLPPARAPSPRRVTPPAPARVPSPRRVTPPAPVLPKALEAPTLAEITRYYNANKPGIFGYMDPPRNVVSIITRIGDDYNLEHGVTVDASQEITSADRIFGKYIPLGTVGYLVYIHPFLHTETNLHEYVGDDAKVTNDVAKAFTDRTQMTDLDLLSTYHILLQRTNNKDRAKEYLWNQVISKFELIRVHVVPNIFTLFGYLYLQMRVFNLVPLPAIPDLADWIFDPDGIPLYVPEDIRTPEEERERKEFVVGELNKMRDAILSMYQLVMEHIDSL